MKKYKDIPPYIEAAQTAFLLATLWVLHFLITVAWGSNSNFGFIGTPIIDVVLNGTGGEEVGSFALFIILTRYLLTFGLVWPILTWLFSWSDRRKAKNSQSI